MNNNNRGNNNDEDNNKNGNFNGISFFNSFYVRRKKISKSCLTIRIKNVFRIMLVRFGETNGFSEEIDSWQHFSNDLEDCFW